MEFDVFLYEPKFTCFLSICGLRNDFGYCLLDLI